MYGSVHLSCPDSHLGSSYKNMTGSRLPHVLISFWQNLMTWLNINISDRVSYGTIQTRREVGDNPAKQQSREDSKARQSDSTLILLLGPTGKEKNELHSHKHHFICSLLLWQKPSFFSKLHLGQWPQRRTQLSGSTVFANRSQRSHI